jgi:hypothetical protein
MEQSGSQSLCALQYFQLCVITPQNSFYASPASPHPAFRAERVFHFRNVPFA